MGPFLEVCSFKDQQGNTKNSSKKSPVTSSKVQNVFFSSKKPSDRASETPSSPNGKNGSAGLGGSGPGARAAALGAEDGHGDSARGAQLGARHGGEPNHRRAAAGRRGGTVCSK